MERFVRLVVGGGLCLLAGLWLVSLTDAATVTSSFGIIFPARPPSALTWSNCAVRSPPGGLQLRVGQFVDLFFAVAPEGVAVGVILVGDAVADLGNALDAVVGVGVWVRDGLCVFGLHRLLPLVASGSRSSDIPGRVRPGTKGRAPSPGRHAGVTRPASRATRQRTGAASMASSRRAVETAAATTTTATAVASAATGAESATTTATRPRASIAVATTPRQVSGRRYGPRVAVCDTCERGDGLSCMGGGVGDGRRTGREPESPAGGTASAPLDRTRGHQLDGKVIVLSRSGARVVNL